MCHYTFVQTHGMYKHQDEPYGLWGIMMGQRWFISWNKCTTPVGNVDNGGREGEGAREKSLYLPVDFAANLKLL